MISICNKNIECCGCPNMDNCTMSKCSQLMQELFTRYNYHSKDTAEHTIHIFGIHPEKLHKQSEVLRRIESANQDIERLEKYIAMLTAYRMELVNRYNYLETTPTKTKIKLQRYKKYQGKVYYYIIYYSIDLETGHEEETKRITYAGTERKKAIEEFDKLCKNNPNFIIEKDIAKGKWEK